MKAIKTTIGQTGPALYIKGLIIGTLVGGVVLTVLLCLCSLFLLISGTLPHEYLSIIGIGMYVLSAFVSGYITSRITKQNGLLCGALSGIIMFLIILLAGFISGDGKFTYLTLIRLAGLTLLGTVGGIKGVNRKEKLHIK